MLNKWFREKNTGSFCHRKMTDSEKKLLLRTVIFETRRNKIFVNNSKILISAYSITHFPILSNFNQLFIFIFEVFRDVL